MEKSLGFKTYFEGKVVKLEKHEVELENGSKSFREVVRHPGAVAVVALLEDRVLMVKQYRFPVEDDLLEIPAGKLEMGEDPLECAKRELMEETGCSPKKITLMTQLYTSPGFSDERIYLYLAEVERNSAPNPDEDEIIDAIEMPFEEVLQLILEGKIRDGKTIAGILFADRIRNRW
ncbi:MULTISPECIES: NUDIX hydrolase [Kosmotoga]|jgi:ADP-ribose pyrophosphatase|uniref:NUDIX hydrolase n=1 Tax=Kosmotoga olearia (strain ATCC BAA-1733 / DSM 21960 / TBF 19.5.1) TaxID=521045 RepID=C5CFQ3_KOSOT|nr:MULTISPECIES: NUDIX hydrolase [Kosmotoga]ACR80401.1 NUDIX hydrolase [Kosmotoga olearia TBF 19.5.1]MDI3523373.1 ADP-ribose pyrophosphatase [Kosmotoga sp.]MDK2952871.1 ADP-ribose pyrophosphatase [Kosmotoga sp.]OAA19902.1 ADP-ribose pyrophosphatase [Kosmotoga sp. DU53]